jgi:NAD(P)-dependent dehydrogenase (short-subunit alcohol dehydrogenase family)
MDRINDRTALVTGAASGIGFAVALALLDAGARVALIDLDEGALRSAAERLGPSARPWVLDVTDRDGWARVASEVEAELGAVEILMNNAGIGPDLRTLADMPYAAFDRLVQVKLTGTFNGIHTLAARMRDRGEGHIVNTASMAAVMAIPRLGAYTAAMSGVVGMSEVLRLEMAEHGIGVSVLCPGLVRTNLSKNTPAELRGDAAVSDMSDGIDPAIVGDRVVEAIRRDELYIFTHGDAASWVHARNRAVDEAISGAPVRG